MSILEHFGSHLGAWGRHGDSKWLSKGPAREPKEVLEPWEKAGRKSDDFGGSRGGHTLGGGRCKRMGFSHFGTPGKGSRLHGSAFQAFADFAVPCG